MQLPPVPSGHPPATGIKRGRVLHSIPKKHSQSFGIKANHRIATMTAISPAALAELQAFFEATSTWDTASFIMHVKAAHNRWLALSYSHLVKEVGIHLDRPPMTLAIALEREEVFEWLATNLEIKVPSVGSQEPPFKSGVEMGGFRASPDDRVISFGSVQKGAWEEQAIERAQHAMACWSRGMVCMPPKAKAERKRKQASSSSDVCDEAHVAPAVRLTRKQTADTCLQQFIEAAKSMHAFMLADLD